MKTFGFIIILFVTASNAFAQNSCSLFFDNYDSIQSHEVETQDGKPRYYSVKNYGHLKGGELDAYLKSIKNLTQFSEKLEEASTHIPDQVSIPSEAFFVANKIIPHIEDFLKQHSVNYRIETFQRSEDSKNKRSVIVILETGKNPLNEISAELSKHGRILLTVDPIELFYGYEHYNQSQGKLFDLDAYTPAYAMSFYLLLHSQRKDFNFSKISKTDHDLAQLRSEILIDKFKNGEAELEESQVARETYEESFQESRKRRADHINELIKKATKKD